MRVLLLVEICDKMEGFYALNPFETCIGDSTPRHGLCHSKYLVKRSSKPDNNL